MYVAEGTISVNPWFSMRIVTTLSKAVPDAAAARGILSPGTPEKNPNIIRPMIVTTVNI